MGNPTWPSNNQSAILSLEPDYKSKNDFPSEIGYRSAARVLDCDVNVIKAVAMVEAARYGAFLDTGEPLILFERHWFDKLTNGKYRGMKVDSSRIPDSARTISSPIAGGYGTVGIQHEKLSYCVSLDRTAALKSCSWGLFQIMGFNHVRAGFPDMLLSVPGKIIPSELTPSPGIQRFVNAMYRSVDDHLAAFVNFILADKRLVKALRDRDFKTFKRIYNGPKENGYEKKMQDAYEGLIK